MTSRTTKLYIFTIIYILFTSTAYTQNGSFHPISGIPQRVSAPIGNTIDINTMLTKKYYENLEDYNNFISSCINNYDTNKDGIKYKAQNLALDKFKENMSLYVRNQSWELAQSCLIQSKSRYYEDYNMLLDKFNDECKENIIKGNIAYDSRNFKEAIYNYNKVLSMDSKYAYLNLKIGISYYLTEDMDNAMKHLNMYNYSYPNESSSHFYKAQIFKTTNNKNRAIEELNEAISLDQNNAEYYLECGWLNLDINNYAQSLYNFNNALKLDPYSTNGYYGRSITKSWLNDNEGEFSDIKKTLELDPRHSMANNNMGWHYFKIKNYTLAISYLNRAILYDPNNSTAYDSRGEVKFNQKNYTGAIIDMKKAIELDPESSNSYLIKARAEYKLGLKNEAYSDFNKSAELGNIEALSYIKSYFK